MITTKLGNIHCAHPFNPDFFWQPISPLQMDLGVIKLLIRWPLIARSLRFIFGCQLLNWTQNFEPHISMNHSSMKKVLHWILAGWILSISTGCSGFHRAWRQETTTNPTYPPSTVEGAWEGEWISESNGHRGRLRCLFTGNEDGTYTTWYHAKYLKFLGFAYAVEVSSNPSDEGYSLSGQADLGKLA